jgi:dTMP kinase
MKKAKFITLEGGEGLGKTTNLGFIRQLLENQGISVVVTREPGGTVLAEKLRNLLLENQDEIIDDKTELLLMFAARAQHITNVINPALERGDWVLCDRFTDSTYAYQGGGRKFNLYGIAWLEQFVQLNLRPDLTLLFDAPVEIGVQRSKKRGVLDRIEVEELIFFSRVRGAYFEQAAKHPSRIKMINANQDLEAVQGDIQQMIEDFIKQYPTSQTA